MKIYNKIVLEWNEETQKYDKVVEEDSFNYEGELILAVPFLALASLAKGAYDIYSASKNKPKWKDYEPSRKYLDKYTASLRGKGAETYRAHMQPQIRQIGSVSRKMARERRYAAAKSGLEGSGIVAQERLSAGANILEGIQKAGEYASIKRVEQQERSREAIASATMKHEQDVDVARRQFGVAGREHGAQMRQAVGNLAFSAVTTGIGHVQKVSGLKASLGADRYKALRAKGYSDDQLTKIASAGQVQEMSAISKEYTFTMYLDSLIEEGATPSGKTTTGDQPLQTADISVIKPLKDPGIPSTVTASDEYLREKGSEELRALKEARSAAEPYERLTTPESAEKVSVIERAKNVALFEKDIREGQFPGKGKTRSQLVGEAFDDDYGYEESSEGVDKYSGLSKEEYIAANKANEAAIEKSRAEKDKAGKDPLKGYIGEKGIFRRAEAREKATEAYKESSQRAKQEAKKKLSKEVVTKQTAEKVTAKKAAAEKKVATEKVTAKKAAAEKKVATEKATEVLKAKRELKRKRDEAYKSGKKSIRKTKDGKYRFKFTAPDGSSSWSRDFDSEDEAINTLGKVIGSVYK